MNEIKWNQVLTAVVITGLIVGLFVAFVFPRKVEVDVAGTNATDCLATNQTATDCPAVDVEGCPIYPTCEEQETQSIITGGYLIDGLFLEEDFYEKLSDREIYLFDDEIDFNGDEYNAEEIFTIDGVRLKANSPDFEGNTYLTFSANTLKYAFEISGLDTTLINDEDQLKFNLLGEAIAISNWENEEVTFTQGEEYLLTEEESVVIDGKDVTLEYVLDDVVYVSVNGESKMIEETDTRTIGSLEIKVEYVLYDQRVDRESKAMLIIGEDLEVTVSDGDEYEEDSVWEWVITDNSIGLVLVEDFVEFDGDFNALKPEETLCLPNEYVCIGYNGLIGESVEEYRFDLKNDFVRVKGNFLSGTTEYDTVYINSSGIYDDDNDGVLISNETIELGDTELSLDVTTGRIVVNDFDVNFDLDDTNVGTGDVDYLTTYGILVENPEDSISDNEFTISIPEEKSEGIITVKKGGFETTEEPVCDVDNLELCLDETTCDNAEGFWYNDTCNLEEEVTA